MSEGTPLLPAISPVPARQTRKNVQKWSLFAAVFITVLVGGWVLSGGPSLGPRPVHASVDNVLSHLEHLQRIASLPQHFGSRSVARGFNASADYVVGFLKNHTSLKVWREHLLVQEQVDFEAPTLALNNQSFAHNKHFLTATGSGSGVFNRAPLYFVGGCDADLDSFSYNGPFVALIPQAIPSWRAPSNSCDYSLCSRISFAIQTLGAVAVLVSTSPVAQGYPKPLCATGRISKCSVKEQANAIASVPVMTLSQSASWEFTQRALDARVVSNVSLSANTRYEIIGVDNILAETPGGNPNSIVLFGSHLDSIRGGPGVNDDGSGAMATLELAYALSSSSAINKTVQKVRFAWWTAEEIGLIGSTYHVEQLFAKDPVELAKYKLNIDTDMIASPNYVRGVWDGRNVPDERIRAAGAAIQSVFERFFAKRGLATVPFAFNGRSDFAPFMRRGIPAGGVITGEDEIKSAHEAELFGGVAGMVLDPNYHQPTDTVESLRGPGRAVLEQNLEALANALGVFAFHKDLDAFLRGGR